MTTKTDHLEDLYQRMRAAKDAGAFAALGLKAVHRGRIAALPPEKLPALLVYAPAEALERRGSGHPVFAAAVTLAVRVVVAPDEGWDLLASEIADRVLEELLTDGVWTARWNGAPLRVERTQRISNHPEADAAVTSEIVTLVVDDRFAREYPLRARSELRAVTTAIGIVTPAVPGGTPDIVITQETEE